MLEQDLLSRLAAILSALGNQECPDCIVSGPIGKAVQDWEKFIVYVSNEFNQKEGVV